MKQRRTDRIDFNAPGGCWVWLAGKSKAGYGMMRINGVRWLVHRFMYTQIVGPIPEGLEIDHLCRNRACCNPDHLEPVTHAVNIQRSPVKSNQHRGKTHCIRGHAFDETNTYEIPGGGRACKICRKLGYLGVKPRKSECKHGHTLDADNTLFDKNGMMYCKTCRRAAQARIREKRALLGVGRNGSIRRAQEATI